MTPRVRRPIAAQGVRAAALLVLVVLVRTSVAAAGPGLAVGVSDNAFLWKSQAALAAARELGVSSFRVTLPWTPGQTELDSADAAQFDAMVRDAGGMRIVVSIYGAARSAPNDDAGRDAYCTYVRNLLQRYPTINDVVIWNEANLGFYWQPQFDETGASVAPAAYEALLARCWDVLHALRPNVNVITSTSPGGNDSPTARSNVSHSPLQFIRKLGAAYRASGRTTRIFDTVGHNPYGSSSSESPWRRHLAPSVLAEADGDRLVRALDEAFTGTAQPTPVRCTPDSAPCVSVWYLEAGYQTIPDDAHRAGYVGRENDAKPVVDAPDSTNVTQSAQLTDGVELAYCQPYVGAFFNFLVWDEPDLARWQSGVLWADGSKKASFGALQRVVDETRARTIDCAKLAAAHASQQDPSPDALIDRVEWSPLEAFSAFNDIWGFAIAVRQAATFRATIYRVSGRSSTAAMRLFGSLPGGRPRDVRFPARTLSPGTYRMEVLATAKRRLRPWATRLSPTFVVSRS
jgi:hypothetical protein